MLDIPPTITADDSFKELVGVFLEFNYYFYLVRKNSKAGTSKDTLLA